MIEHESVSILVVTHNHADYIDKLLQSLQRQQYWNTYFCDAASTDGTLQKLQASPFRDRVLAKTELHGFSKNNNDLIRHFKLESKYYLLLNPDTYFDQDFLEILVQKMVENPETGIAAPLLKYPDGKLQVTWKSFPGITTVLRKRMGMLDAVDEAQLPGPYIDWCLGACMLISHDLKKEGGHLLDERYRLYCEDIDICFEARNNGLKVLGVQECHIFHNLNEKSAKNIFSKYNYWNISSILKFILKWNLQYFIKK